MAWTNFFGDKVSHYAIDDDGRVLVTDAMPCSRCGELILDFQGPSYDHDDIAPFFHKMEKGEHLYPWFEFNEATGLPVCCKAGDQKSDGWSCKDCGEEFPETEQPWVGRDDAKRCQICDMHERGCSHAAIARAAEKALYGSAMVEGFDLDAEANAHNWGLDE